MTKNEKIAISISAVGGFVIFCLVCIFMVLPLCSMMGEIFSSSLRVTTVDYDNLAYAMGEEFVYVDKDIFDYDLTLEDLPQIEYYGRSSSFSQTKPIKGAKRYAFGAKKDYNYNYHYQIRISCEKSKNLS